MKRKDAGDSDLGSRQMLCGIAQMGPGELADSWHVTFLLSSLKGKGFFHGEVTILKRHLFCTGAFFFFFFFLKMAKIKWVWKK